VSTLACSGFRNSLLSNHMPWSLPSIFKINVNLAFLERTKSWRKVNCWLLSLLMQIKDGRNQPRALLSKNSFFWIPLKLGSIRKTNSPLSDSNVEIPLTILQKKLEILWLVDIVMPFRVPFFSERFPNSRNLNWQTQEEFLNNPANNWPSKWSYKFFAGLLVLKC